MRLYYHVLVFEGWPQRRCRFYIYKNRMERMRGNGYKLFLGELCFTTRGTFFPVRTISHWNDLPWKAVDSPTLDTLRSSQARYLGYLV